MGLTIEGKSGNKYYFNGPFSTTGELEDKSGVYAILCRKDDELHFVDLGESSEVRTRVEDHDRKDCWEENCNRNLRYAVYYIEHGKKPSRVEVEQDIRGKYHIPCGEK